MSCKSYNKLIIEQLAIYPETTIISAKKFLKYHINDHQSLKVIITIMNDNNDPLYYYINKAPKTISSKAVCNGIRTGLGSAYCSFPYIDITI